MSIQQLIGTRIREQRKKIGLTQQEFAGKAGVSRSAQIKYERAEATPNALYLSRVADLIDVLYVVTGDGAKSKTLSPRFKTVCPDLGHAFITANEIHHAIGVQLTAEQIQQVAEIVHQSAKKETI